MGPACLGRLIGTGLYLFWMGDAGLKRRKMTGTEVRRT